MKIKLKLTKTLLKISVLLLTFLFSCESNEVLYTGLNDKVIGVDQIVLYTNSKFYLEIGLGGKKGEYTIKNDTIKLNYTDRIENYPKYLIMNEDHFITEINVKQIKIKRIK